MTDIYTHRIFARVDVDGVSLAVTEAEIELTRGVTANYAEIVGWTDSPGEIELDAPVTVTINDIDIFSGVLRRATQDEDGKVTLECYDLMVQLHNLEVKYNSSEPQGATTVANKLLTSAGITLAPRPSDFDSGGAYIAAKSTFPRGDAAANRQYGSAKNGERLSRVLQDLARKLGGYLWTDESGMIRLEPYPTHDVYESPRPIKEIEAGEETTEKNRVIVHGGTPVGDLGKASQYVYQETSISSEITQDDDETIAPGTLTVDDLNTSTQQEAENVAVATNLENTQVGEAATVTFVGMTAGPNPSAEIQPFDYIQMDDLRLNNDVLLRGVSFYETVFGNRYEVDSVVHTLDASNGYEVEVSLTPASSTALAGMTGPSASAASTFLDKLRDSGESAPMELAAYDPEEFAGDI